MSYTTAVIFILLGLLVVIVRHFIWRGMVTIIRKPLITTIGLKYKNGKGKKLIYADTKYKNQQLIISLVGFFVFSFVLIVVFIWLPDMWVGYQIILSVAAVLVPGIFIGILMSRRNN